MPLQDPSPHGNPRHSGGGEKAHPLSSASKLLPPHLFSILASCFLALASANAADVRISGLQTITNKEALGILKPRLVFINARPASPARANDAAFLLSQLLKNQGLPANKVSWTISNSNTISLTVEEGPVRVIGNISIFNIDNQKLHDEILDYFLEPPIGTPLFSEAALPYLVESIDIAQKDATQHLQALGYWSAKITVENVPNPVDLSLVDLDVNIDLGPRYKLGKTVITGQLPTLDEKLQNELDRYIEKIANTENILALKELVTNSLYAAGYNFADVNLTQTLGSEENPGLLILAVDVQAGLTYRLGQLDITTAKDDKTNRTDINRLEDLFQKAKGQPYDRKLINKQRDKMLATGAFDAIRIVNKPNDDTGIIDIELELDESRARGVSGYGGIGSEEGLILGASFHDRNFLGKLWNFNIDTEFSNIGLLGQIRLSNPWFLGTDHPLNTRLWLLTREFEGYQKFEFGSEASVEFKVDDHYNLNLYANATWVDIDSLGLPSSALGDDNYAVQRIGLTQTFDLRNSKILPNDGFYIALDTELGNVLANDPILFTRLEARLGYYYKISSQRHITARARVGGIYSSSDNTDLPIDLRYFLGGANTVRSFPFRELGPSINRDPTGGETFWSSSLEYIQKIKGPFSALLFFDAGGLETDSFKFGKPSYSIGTGLRLDLPIGPARLEYGYNLNEQPGEPTGTLHFSLGLAF